MSKKLSFKGSIIPAADEQRIKLATLDGKTGYRITKFQIISSTPGEGNEENICQIHTKEQGPSNTVDFTNDSLMAVCYTTNVNAVTSGYHETIIFDNTKFNQDVYLVYKDSQTNSVGMNYYIEMETSRLALDENTVATLKDIRNIESNV